MPEAPELVIITGMSGAGRSTASKALEDLGFHVIDNLPVDLISRVVSYSDPMESTKRRRVAVVVDTRSHLTFEDLEQSLLGLALQGVPTSIVFLDADDDSLAKRFSESRRPHPVSAPTVSESIAAEREALADVRGEADVVIDTTDRSVHELRGMIEEIFAGTGPRRPLRVNVTSFGFKHGVPRIVDLMFDVRFLPNPHWDPELRPLTGRDEAVRDYVFSHEEAGEFLDRVTDMLGFLLPRFDDEGKTYLTIGVGCTGGKHRSVALADAIASFVEGLGYDVSVTHRDMPKDGT
ncbi:MAG TPA: RNase adapter RapZ [Acidimicrobiia bacterium]|nr:RNase adapter RapZ [Acidimicrobiia bacterium]